MVKKLKYKKGDLVQVYTPMIARIKRINKKRGYTLEILPTNSSETAYFSDEELVKVSKKSDWYKDTIKSAKKRNSP